MNLKDALPIINFYQQKDASILEYEIKDIVVVLNNPEDYKILHYPDGRILLRSCIDLFKNVGDVFLSKTMNVELIVSEMSEDKREAWLEYNNANI